MNDMCELYSKKMNDKCEFILRKCEFLLMNVIFKFYHLFFFLYTIGVYFNNESTAGARVICRVV